MGEEHVLPQSEATEPCGLQLEVVTMSGDVLVELQEFDPQSTVESLQDKVREKLQEAGSLPSYMFNLQPGQGETTCNLHGSFHLVSSSGQFLTTTTATAQHSIAQWSLAQCGVKSGETLTAVVVQPECQNQVPFLKRVVAEQGGPERLPVFNWTAMSRKMWWIRFLKRL
eukprot:gnl/MRDRNA2_/MRDRNA2_99665_c0_seq1.p1 gnl/MRDRNA2_/MRDRNA2_99665_c0~~gnl/MRDRNA2_/MRDRNA2_99665_c0_seq1.p1  ORF type:complete len:169 (-),score=31.74 gnl/MRDRNA2_/MRDRNA2_99665_c0_seq1:325-831(-)